MKLPFVSRRRYHTLVMAHKCLHSDYEELFDKYYRLLQKQPKRDKNTGRFVTK